MAPCSRVFSKLPALILVHSLLISALQGQNEFADFSSTLAATSASNPTSDEAILSSLLTDTSATSNPFDNNAITPSYGLIATPGTRLQYTGNGVVAYQERPLSTSGVIDLGCGFGWIGPSFIDSYVGIGQSFMYRGFSCGRCVKLQCDDNSCQEPGRQLIALVADACGECFDADINVAQPLFEKLAGRSSNTANTGGSGGPTLAISWEFADCGELINGTIKMLLKPGGSAYFQSFNFANSREVITAVAVNGERLQHSTSNWWDWSSSKGPINPNGPFDFALLGANNQVLRVQIGQLRSQDIGIQFSLRNPPTLVAPAPEPEVPVAIPLPAAGKTSEEPPAAPEKVAPEASKGPAGGRK